MKIYVFGHLDIFFWNDRFFWEFRNQLLHREHRSSCCMLCSVQEGLHSITRLQDHFQIFFHFQNFRHFVQSLLFGNLYSLQIKQYLLHLSVGDVCLNLVNPEIATINPRHAQKLHRKNFVCPRCFHRNGEDGVQFVRSLPTISIFKYSQSGRDCCHHHCLLF